MGWWKRLYKRLERTDSAISVAERIWGFVSLIVIFGSIILAWVQRNLFWLVLDLGQDEEADGVRADVVERRSVKTALRGFRSVVFSFQVQLLPWGGVVSPM